MTSFSRGDREAVQKHWEVDLKDLTELFYEDADELPILLHSPDQLRNLAEWAIQRVQIAELLVQETEVIEVLDGGMVAVIREALAEVADLQNG